MVIIFPMNLVSTYHSVTPIHLAMPLFRALGDTLLQRLTLPKFELIIPFRA